MSIQRTIFGAKVPYKKQQYDGQLQLQQMPDTSAQAAQPFREEIEAATVQQTIDRNHAEFAYEKQLEQASVIKQDTLLAKLAPFSPIIQELTQIPIDKFEEWRDNQAKEEVGRQKRLAELEGGIEAMEANFSNPIVKSLENNPEASAALRSNVFSWDLGMKRRIASYKAKAFAKDYKAGYESWSNSGATIVLPDATSPTGTREIPVSSISRMEEIPAAQRAFRERMKPLFADDEPEVWQEFLELIADDEAKIRAKLVRQVNGIRGAHEEAQALQAFDGGASMALTLKRLAFANTKDGIVGFPKAIEILEKHIKLGITNGDYTLYHIDQIWAKQDAFLPGEKDVGKNETYRRTLLNSLRQHWRDSKEKRVSRTMSQHEALAESIKESVQEQVFRLRQRPDLREIQQIRDKILGLTPNADLSWLDDIERGYSTHAEERKDLKKKYDTFIIRQQEAVDPAKLQAELLNFPDLYNSYREANARNNAAKQDPLFDQYEKNTEAWLLNPSSSPQGGGDFKFDIAGPKGYASVVGVAKAMAQYRQMRGTAMSMLPIDATEEQKRQVLTGVHEEFKLWFNQERVNKKSPFFYGNQQGVGGYYQVHRYDTGDGKVLSGNDLAKLSQANTQRLIDFSDAATSKFGNGPDAIERAFKDPETLSLIITKEEAEHIAALALQGKPLPARLKYLVSHVTGGSPLQLAALAVKTHTGKDIVFGNNLDNPAYVSTFDTTMLSRNVTQKMLNKTGAQQQRQGAILLHETHIHDPGLTAPTAATQGEGNANYVTAAVPMTKEEFAQRIQDPDFLNDPIFRQQYAQMVAELGEEEVVARLRGYGNKHNIPHLKTFTLRNPNR